MGAVTAGGGRLLDRLPWVLRATYGHRAAGMVSQASGLALQALHDAMQVGLMYLGAGMLLWVVVVVIALVIR